MAKWVRTRIDLPDGLRPSEREAILTDVVQFIRDRTAKGLDKDGKPFKKYTQGYIQSLDFKNAGKSKGRVNLKLSGDMMAALDVISHGPGSGLIGFAAGTPENDRAEGNILGSYGRDPDPSKARDFLGISDKDLQRIIQKKKIPIRVEMTAQGSRVRVRGQR